MNIYWMSIMNRIQMKEDVQDVAEFNVQGVPYKVKIMQIPWEKPARVV